MSSAFRTSTEELLGCVGGGYFAGRVAGFGGAAETVAGEEVDAAGLGVGGTGETFFFEMVF